MILAKCREIRGARVTGSANGEGSLLSKIDKIENKGDALLFSIHKICRPPSPILNF